MQVRRGFLWTRFVGPSSPYRWFRRFDWILYKSSTANFVAGGFNKFEGLATYEKKTAVPCWVFAHIIFGHAFSILFSVTGAERCCDPSRLSQFAFGSFLVSSFQHKYCLDDVAKMRGKHVVACGHTASDKSSAAEAKFITLSVVPAFQDFSGIPWVVVVSFFRLGQGCKSAQFERWRGGFCATGVSFLLACLQCLQC